MGLAVIVCLFMALPAMAESEPVPEIELETVPKTDPDGWKFGGSAYLWAAGVKGTDSAGDKIDVSFSDILKDLDGGIMGGIAARKGKWMFLADILYLSIHQKTSSTAKIIGLPGKIDLDVKLKGYITTFGVAYRVIENDAVTLDMLVGGRYFQLDLDLDAKVGGSLTRHSDSDYVLDGIIGSQVLYNLSDRLYFSCYGDVGAGDSKLTWQVWPGFGYRLKHIDVVAGYRHLAWETDDGESIDDIAFSGPMAGVKFPF